MTGRRPFEVPIAELRRHPGTRRAVEVSAPLSGLATSSAAVPEDGEVGVEVELEALAHELVATGTVRAPWAGECRRCLAPVTGVLEVRVQEVFEPRPTEGDTYRLGEDTVDLEPMVRDAVLLALPLSPLCAEGCVGPAPDTFPTGPMPAADEVEGTDGGEGDGGDDDAGAPGGGRRGPRDPRWAALDELRFDE